MTAVMLDHLKIKATIAALERTAFGPVPETQVRQLRHRSPPSPVPLDDILETNEEARPLLQWLSWDATFEDAKRALIAFHTGSTWATCGNSNLPECVEALRILREEPDAKRLICHVLNHSKSEG